MIQSRQYHGLNLEIAKVKGNRVCYFLLPEGLKPDGIKFLEEAAQKYDASMVVLSGFNWNDALTPWPASGVFKEKKPFGGKAKEFLKALQGEYLRDVEQAFGILKPERYLVGVSLSGLFAIWSLTQTNEFRGVAAISPSLWYDHFVEWLAAVNLKVRDIRVHISLGDREKNSKEPRMAAVQSATEDIVGLLTEKGANVDYQLIPGTHFSAVIPRLEMALSSMFSE